MRKISSRRTREDDDISLIDDTENEIRQRWSAVAINDENKSLKRKETVPEKGKSRNKHMKVVTSSSSDNSSESSEDSDSDNEIFHPGHSKVFDKKYIEKYATKGITKKNRQIFQEIERA